MQEVPQNRPSSAVDRPAAAPGFYDHYADIEKAKQQMEEEDNRSSQLTAGHNPGRKGGIEADPDYIHEFDSLNRPSNCARDGGHFKPGDDGELA